MIYSYSREQIHRFTNTKLCTRVHNCIAGICEYKSDVKNEPINFAFYFCRNWSWVPSNAPLKRQGILRSSFFLLIAWKDFITSLVKNVSEITNPRSHPRNTCDAFIMQKFTFPGNPCKRFYSTRRTCTDNTFQRDGLYYIHTSCITGISFLALSSIFVAPYRSPLTPFEAHRIVRRMILFCKWQN